MKFTPLRQAVFLSRQGVPWEFAVNCDDATRSALCIIAGELDGGVFDWGEMGWRQQAG